MIDFDASDISNWSNQPDANHQLPDLVRRLILATVSELSHLDMPSGSAVWLPGWDGTLTAKTGNTWVPNSTSAWEFSCRSDAGTKASEDYRKRTRDPKGISIAASTFVFVTPRQWPGKNQWAKQRRAEGKWADVQAFDATDLPTWLSQAPAVAEWFGRLIRKLPSAGYICLDEWWDNWASIAQPSISPALVLAGRQERADRLAEWVQQTATPYYVKAQTRDEAIAFVAASALHSGEEWGATLLAKALVVKSEEAWNSLVRHTAPLVLVRAFDGNVSSQVAAGRGHHVITPLHENDEPVGNGIKLPRADRNETVKALNEMGMSESSARALIRRTARSLPVMRRFLIDEAGSPTPDWASVESQSTLPSLMLIGQWDESNENDKETVAEITGRPYEEAAREVASLVQSEERPLTKVGSRWRFLSHEEAWHLLAPRLTAGDVARFEQQAVRVLGAVSSAYELPKEERHLAGIRGKGTPHSGPLREGIARTLAIMGNQGERTKNAGDVSHIPGKILRRVLADNEGWEIWATLGRNLPTLAEADPEALLGAIEQCLAVTPSPFKALFTQEGDPLFSEASHTGLLWALERLAWAPEYFARVANALALLSLTDAGGHIANRPGSSLVELFLPRYQSSETPDEERLTALNGLIHRVPEPGWKALVYAHPSFLAPAVADRQPPSWRPWGQDERQQPTDAEFYNFTEGMERLLLEHVGDDVERWKDVVGIIQNLTPDTRQQMLTLLTQRTDDMRQHPNSSELWKALRFELNRHRSHPDAKWAIPSADLEPLEVTYQELTPEDPATAYAWLFEGDPHLPEGNSYQRIDRENNINVARQSAIVDAYDSGGSRVILSIAENAAHPRAVGWALATSVGVEQALTLALEHVGSENRNYQQMAHGILWTLFQQSGWPLLEDAVNRLKATDCDPRTVGNLFLIAPATRDTWDRLAAEEPDTQRCYWEQMNPWGVTYEEDMSLVAEKLLEVQRSAEVAEWIAHSPVRHEIVVRTLEQLPTELSAMTAPGLGGYGLLMYGIVQLLEKLDQSETVGDDTIARLELPFISTLRYHGRPNLAVYREIAKEPSLFADLIASNHRRKDGQTDAVPSVQRNEVTTAILTQMLTGNGETPGKMEDGTIDHEILSTWAHEARRLCTERGHGEIGDIYIGKLLAKAPAGADGIWPCEPVREMLDKISSPEIGKGLVTGRIGLRGATSRGIFEGGTQEYHLADHYRKDAAATRSRWPFTASLLGQIAEWYRTRGKWEDQEADRRDQYEF